LSTPAVKLSQRHDVTLAVPPPRFNLPVPLARPTSKARVTLRGSHSFRGFFSARCLGSPGLDFQRALGILRSDCNPWRPFPKTLVYRAALPPAPHPELPMMRLPKKSDPSLSGPRYRHLPSVRHRHFLRDETLYPCGSGLGCGPCPAWGTDSLPRFGLQGDPVHVFHDSYIGSSGPFAAIPRCRRYSRKNRKPSKMGLAQLPIVYRRHRYRASSIRPGCGRLSVWRDRALFRDCEVARRLSGPLFGLPTPNV
jgi:hypothetical protein